MGTLEKKIYDMTVVSGDLITLAVLVSVCVGASLFVLSPVTDL